MDLLPKHPGTVAYDVISNVKRPTSPSFARIQFNFVVHDPKLPSEVNIVSPLPECKPAQLRIASLPPLISESKKFLRVYEATNISTAACSLAGVPRLNLRLNPGSPCPNCTNDLFGIRPNGRIDLAPDDSAHFLLGTAVHIQNWDEENCNPVPSITLMLDETSKGLELPYGRCGGGTLDLSTWREGRFDGDPLNLQWAKTHLAYADPSTPIPSDCNKPELLANGHPYIVQSAGGLSLGFSIMQHEYIAGDPIKLHVWVDNAGGTPAGVMTCMTLDLFKAQGFELFDAFGHRVLNKDQAKRQEMCATNPRMADRSFGWSCTRNFPIMIPAHTCITRDDFDFVTVLNGNYDLPPGTYTLRRHTALGRALDVCEPPGKEMRDRQSGDIIFSVMQP